MNQVRHSTQYMTALFLPFTPPNEFDTIMYSLERWLWIRLQPCMQYIVVLGLLQHCSIWKKVVVLKQLIRQRSPTKYRCELRVISYVLTTNCTTIALILLKHHSVICTILAFVFEI